MAGSWLPRIPLLALGASKSELREGGSITCSLSAPSSFSLMGNEWGKPNMKRAEQKSKAPHSRKPNHQAPIQRGSSGVMGSTPVGGGRGQRGSQQVAGPADQRRLKQHQDSLVLMKMAST